MDIQKCYRILKVEADAEWPEIKRSFHRLAREHHPDRNAGNRDSEERFKAISTAYKTLEKWNQSRQFSYRVYTQVAPANDDPSQTFEENAHPSRWPDRLWGWLRDYEQRWLELNVEKEVTVDPAIASAGGTIRVKNSSGSFEVQVPRDTRNDTQLRIPGKGEAGLFHRGRGDLLLKIKVQQPRARTSGVAEFFYHVKVSPEQLENPTVRTLQTHQGPIRYRFPRNATDGQSFVLKSRLRSPSGKTHHHIVVIDTL